MNWIKSIRPKIRGLLTTKRDRPSNTLWVKSPDTGQLIFYKDLEANQFVIPGSNYHMRMEVQKRLAHLFDATLIFALLPWFLPLRALGNPDGAAYILLIQAWGSVIGAPIGIIAFLIYVVATLVIRDFTSAQTL